LDFRFKYWTGFKYTFNYYWAILNV